MSDIPEIPKTPPSPETRADTLKQLDDLKLPAFGELKEPVLKDHAGKIDTLNPITGGEFMSVASADGKTRATAYKDLPNGSAITHSKMMDNTNSYDSVSIISPDKQTLNIDYENGKASRVSEYDGTAWNTKDGSKWTKESDNKTPETMNARLYLDKDTGTVSFKHLGKPIRVIQPDTKVIDTQSRYLDIPKL